MAENKTQGAKSGDTKNADTKPAVSEGANVAASRRAAESSDPAVHQLLAQRQTAVSNGDDDEVHRIDGQLADMGFTD